jgi:hypothetical protein
MIQYTICFFDNCGTDNEINKTIFIEYLIKIKEEIEFKFLEKINTLIENNFHTTEGQCLIYVESDPISLLENKKLSKLKKEYEKRMQIYIKSHSNLLKYKEDSVSENIRENTNNHILIIESIIAENQLDEYINNKNNINNFLKFQKYLNLIREMLNKNYGGIKGKLTVKHYFTSNMNISDSDVEEHKQTYYINLKNNILDLIKQLKPDCLYFSKDHPISLFKDIQQIEHKKHEYYNLY